MVTNKSEQVAPVAQAGWLQSDGLLYRLTDGLHPENRDEINVTMAEGSRSIESRARRASELLDKLSAAPVVPHKQEPPNKTGYSLYKDVLLKSIYRNRARPSSKGIPMKFRKKPVVIDAIQWTGSNLYEVMAFMDNAPDLRSQYAVMGWDRYTHLVAKDGLKIHTLEGALTASIGDWVIKGVAGEYYPCKPDIFRTSYEPVEPATSQDQQ